MNPRSYLFPTMLRYQAQIIVGLQPQPGFRRNAEVSSEPQSGIGRDGAKSVHDRADSIRRDIQIASQLINAESERFHEILQKDFAGMNRIERF